MTIRVLHIFSPYIHRRFGGMIPNWRYYFNQWNDIEITHSFLVAENNEIIDAKKALNFEYEQSQIRISRWERFLWISQLLRSLKTHRDDYDLLHFHLLWWGGLLMALWAKRHHIPTLYESVLLDSDTPGSIKHQRFGKIKFWLLHQFSGILAISEGLASDYKNNGFNDDRVFTLVCSVDTKQYRPRKSENEKLLIRSKLNFPQNDIILTFVGSLIYRKGIDLLIDAFVDACHELSNLFLLLVGPNCIKENPTIDEIYLERLLNGAKKQGLTNQIKLLGLVQDRQELAEIYRGSDIFILPSRQEGLGIVILEAMATGLPVIVSQLPVLEDIIIDGENGLFVPLDDHDALKQAILAVSQDPALRERLGRAAFESIQKNNHFSKWQSDLVRIYQGLLLEQKEPN